MRHVEGVLDEREGVAQRNRKLDDAHVVQKRHSHLVARLCAHLFLQLEGQHAGTHAVHLALDDIVASKPGQPGIEHAGDFLSAREILGHRARVGAVARKAHLQSLQAAYGQIRVGRRAHRTRELRHSQRPQVGQVLFVVGDDDAADYVAVSVQVLRHRMHDDVGAVREGALDGWRRESVVHDDQSISCRLLHRCDVGELHQGVVRRLEKDHARVRAHRRLHGLDVARVHRRDLHAELR